MSQPAVVFEHVWKKFRRGERHNSLRDLLPSLARRIVRPTRRTDLSNKDEFWALKDISFNVEHGQALGIVGPNGAGKSTTLKLLTKILRPTRGACEVRGRVGALIEIAAGFHPDLTGRENIFLQGAIMGMKGVEIARKLDAIVEFAGVRDFIDTPVKRYSSGMNARLGFSIAAHFDPEVLIIDEVLSVGDVAYQQRCVERMREFRQRGVAIIFVSHNLQAVSQLCSFALYLKSSQQAFGETAAVLEKLLSDTDLENASTGNGAIVIRSARLQDMNGQPVSEVTSGARLILRLECMAAGDVSDYHVAFLGYRSTDGLPIYDGHWSGEELGLPRLEAGREFNIAFAFTANLTRGHYYLASHFYHNPTGIFLARVHPAAMYAVDERRTYAGVADLAVAAHVEREPGHPLVNRSPVRADHGDGARSPVGR